MHFLPMKTVYECNYGRSTNYTSLAFQHKILTLDRHFTRKRFQVTNRTPFKEIIIADFDSIVSDEYKSFMNVRRGSVYEGRAELLSRLRDALKSVIYENWIPGANHIVMHSSGFDSRCMSWLIHELYHEHGDDWLGNVLFVCSKWEGQSFKSIMEYEGWNESQYTVIREGCEPEDYYAPSLTDFDRAWIWSDGASPLAVNLFWYLCEEAIENGLIDNSNLQTLSGQWGNTTLDYGSMKRGTTHIDEAVRLFYKSILGQRPMYSNRHVNPYGAIRLARVVCESSITLQRQLRPMFLMYLDPTLAAFRNLSADGDRFRPIAEWIQAQMDYDYRTSWYGQHVHPEAKMTHKNTEFQDFWYHWTLASFCKELKRRGIDIQ